MQSFVVTHANCVVLDCLASISAKYMKKYISRLNSFLDKFMFTRFTSGQTGRNKFILCFAVLNLAGCGYFLNQVFQNIYTKV